MITRYTHTNTTQYLYIFFNNVFLHAITNCTHATITQKNQFFLITEFLHATTGYAHTTSTPKKTKKLVILIFKLFNM